MDLQITYLEKNSVEYTYEDTYQLAMKFILLKIHLGITGNYLIT